MEIYMSMKLYKYILVHVLISNNFGILRAAISAPQHFIQVYKNEHIVLENFGIMKSKQGSALTLVIWLHRINRTTTRFTFWIGAY